MPPRSLNLGVMYANGEGVPKDDAEAVRWFQLGWGRQEFEQAGARVFPWTPRPVTGPRQGLGMACTQNNAEAVRWVRLAADQGDAEAQ